MTARLIDDCFRQDPRDQNRLSHDDVIAQLSSRLGPVVGERAVKLDDASGLVAAGDQAATRLVPGHTNAAVDGYAFAHSALNNDSATQMPVVGRAAAGRPFGQLVSQGSAIRIFTGAVLPESCDTVVMQEDCTLADGSLQSRFPLVSVPPGLKAGANVRQAGEDVGPGEMLVHAGSIIRPQDIAALASVGIAEINCYDRMRVAIVSSGDEVIRAGSTDLEIGQVYDTNAPLLSTLATGAGCDVTDLGVLPDSPEAVVACLGDAAETFDVILTSGGASQGEEDYMARAIDQLGARHFWQIAVKPGRPLMFGQIGNAAIVGLPGNPVAVFVCFLMYVRPMLKRMGGARWPQPQRFPLPAVFSFSNRKIGRREFWRGRTVLEDGRLVVEKFSRDGSGLISGLRFATGLIDIPEDVPSISPGDLVNFIPFSEFGIGV